MLKLDEGRRVDISSAVRFVPDALLEIEDMIARLRHRDFAKDGQHRPDELLNLDLALGQLRSSILHLWQSEREAA